MRTFDSVTFIEKALERCGVEPTSARRFLAQALREGRLRKVPNYDKAIEVFEVLS